MTEEQVFLAALECPDATARSAYLDKACGANAGLRKQVEALLTSHFRSGEFLDVPAAVQIQAESSVDNTITVEGDAVSAEHRTEDDSGDLAFLAPTTRSDSLGRIGHYEVLQILGKGGFGIVFRAFDDILQRVVAIKVMAPQIAALSPARRRFVREARSSAQVRHENVVQVYEVGEQPLPYLVMEFIPGETLQQKLDRCGPLDVAEVLRIGRQIAEGLAAAHATDLIHRDIKPGNVLIEGGTQQRVKITDFGLARAADDASISQSGIIAGTPTFMAPEQALGHRLDQRADLFSLGSVLYHMVAGRVPFRANGTVAVLKRVAEDTPRAIHEIIPETPQWLCDIISKLHSKKPDDRYQSAREIADVLAECEVQLKLNARQSAFARTARGKTARSGRGKWVAAALVLLPVIALAATEMAGVTQLLPRVLPAPVAITPVVAPTPVVVPTPVVNPESSLPTYTNSIGMEFMIVPKGKSWLGGGKDKMGDKEVEIPADFYLGKYEVTQEEWIQVMGANPSRFSRNGLNREVVKDIGDADLKRFPVEDVSWDQCQLFVEKLNKLERVTGWVYRLPTEAEWEYACRGGPMADKADSAFDFYVATPTNSLLPDQANFDKGLMRPGKVGSYAANRLGLFDMHGNVFEWCDDKGTTTEGSRMFRGGGWQSLPARCVAITSIAGTPAHRTQYLGLRLARVPTGVPSPEAKSPLAVGAFTDADVQRIAALPAAEQVEQVRKELMRLNPGFDGMLKPTIKDGVVTGLAFLTDEVVNIAPVRALSGLTTLNCIPQSKGKLSDLSPLKGMPLNLLMLDSCSQIQDLSPLKGMPLTNLGLAFCSQVRNLEPLKGMPLTRLNLYGCGVLNLEPLKGMPLTNLTLAATKVRDLEPIKGVKLTSLDLRGCTQVQDLSPLKGMPLKVLLFYSTGVSDLNPLQGMELVEIRLTPKNITNALDIPRNMKSLKTIGIDQTQSWPAAEFWVRYDKGEFKGPVAVAPFTDADVQRIAALPAAEQVEEVRKELMRRNPAFDGTVTHKIEGDQVTELQIVTDKVTDIAPIRVFNFLRVLDLSGTQVNFVGNGQLADLSPLIGMNLAGLGRLNLNFTMVGDEGLVHFKDCMKLTSLGLDTTQVSDTGLAYFKDYTDLTYLNLNRLKISDAGLAHFKNCKNMKFLHFGGTPVGDAGLSYFKECEHLTLLGLSKTRVTDAGLAHFKDCKKLSNLALMATPVTDAGLAHFKDSKELTRLHIGYTKVTDLSLIKGMPLKELDCPFRPERDAEILRSIKTLEKINGKSAAEFWKEVEVQAASAPHDTWLKANALLPPDQHAAALLAKLKERQPGFEEAFVRTIPNLAGDRQSIMVAALLRDRNPAFNGEVTHKIEGGVLTSLEVPSPLVQDLTPLKALPGLRTFTGRTTLGYDNQAARDAAVLRSLTKLETINGKSAAQFWTDAEARQAEFQEWLQLVPTLPAPQQVAAVAAKLKERNPGLDGTAKHKIEGGVVTELGFTPVKGQDAVMDLSPVRALSGMTSLILWGCSGLVDLEPIRGMKLTRLVIGSFHVNNQVRDLEPLKGMPLTELNLYHCQVRDLEPLKGMPLTRLTLMSRQVRDCAPLKGMPLTILFLDTCTQVTDFTPLQGMPLTGLALGQSRFKDVELLKDMPLTLLTIAETPVQDLERLKGLPLKKLSIQKTGVTDLRPLKGMELEEIRLTPKTITQGLDILRDMKSLKTIGIDSFQAWPAAEFWQRHDKGEFK